MIQATSRWYTCMICMSASISTDLSDWHVQYGCSEFVHLQCLHWTKKQQYEEIHKKYKHMHNL